LQLRHPHRHRRHHRHVRVAAHWLAAVAVVGQEFGLVAHTDLPQFDPRLKLAGQELHQFAEVHPFVGQEIKHDALAAEQVFDVDQFHLQAHLADLVAADIVLAVAGLAEVLDALAVVVGEWSDDLPAGRLGDHRDGLRRTGA